MLSVVSEECKEELSDEEMDVYTYDFYAAGSIYPGDQPDSHSAHYGIFVFPNGKHGEEGTAKLLRSDDLPVYEESGGQAFPVPEQH